MREAKLMVCSVVLTVMSLSVSLRGQTDKNNHLGFLIGGEFVPSNSLVTAAGTASREIKSSASYSLELNYGRRLHDFRYASLWLDIPALVGPSHRISNGNMLLPTSNATFYVTPSVRLAFPNKTRVTPWVSSGFGYGLFETSDTLFGGSSNPIIHTHTGVAQFGGGVDLATPFRILFPIGLRGEFRDFYALNHPIYFVPAQSDSQHNLAVLAGVHISF